MASGYWRRLPAVLAMLAFPAVAQAAACPPERVAPPKVEFRTFAAKPTYRNQLSRAQITAHAGDVERRLRQAADAIDPFTTGRPKEAGQEVTRHLMRALQPVLDDFNAELRRANASIDTKDNYRKLSGYCRGW